MFCRLYFHHVPSKLPILELLYDDFSLAQLMALPVVKLSISCGREEK